MSPAGKVYPPVIVVDENDHEIGSAPLAEVWQKGLYHRIVSVFVTDNQDNMLLQLRGDAVQIHPNCWDQAAGGHVDAGFSYDQTAVNELAEETGLRGCKLTPLGTFRTNTTLDDGRIINQFERAYLARVSREAPLARPAGSARPALVHARRTQSGRHAASREVHAGLASCAACVLPCAGIINRKYHQ